MKKWIFSFSRNVIQHVDGGAYDQISLDSTRVIIDSFLQRTVLQTPFTKPWLNFNRNLTSLAKTRQSCVAAMLTLSA